MAHKKGTKLKLVCIRGHNTLILGRDKWGKCIVCRREDRRKAHKKNCKNPEFIQNKIVYGKKYREEHKEEIKIQHRKYRLLKKYNITQEQYDEMLQKQEGKCAICGKHQDELNKILCVDHDHKTGKVRGLLCTECNSIFIRTVENPLFDKVLEYLKKYN